MAKADIQRVLGKPADFTEYARPLKAWESPRRAGASWQIWKGSHMDIEVHYREDETVLFAHAWQHHETWYQKVRRWWRPDSPVPVLIDPVHWDGLPD